MGITVFVLHDTDPAGYVIYDDLRAEVEAHGGVIHDISWSVDECLRLGKEPESDYRRCAKEYDELHGLPERIMPLLSPAARKLFLGRRVPNPGIHYKRPTPFVWEYHRIELNDIFTDSEYAMRTIEERLKAHGCKKLVPPKTVLERHARERRDTYLRLAIHAEIDQQIDVEGLTASVGKSLNRRIDIKGIPAQVKSWAEELVPARWTHHVDTLVADDVAKVGAAIRGKVAAKLREVLS